MLSYNYKKYIFPKDWCEFRLDKLLRLTERPIIMRDDQKYELVTVRRNFGGVDSRGLYYGKDILVKTQFEIVENDFIISKRQIAHGACGIVPENLGGAIVSNEYNIFLPTELLNIDFLDFYVRLPFTKKYFFIMSDGVHIEKLLFKPNSWLKQKVTIPPLPEQQKIAEILSTWDKAIELKDQLIEAKKQQKKGLMKKLLTGELRLPGFEGEWEDVSFEMCFNTISVKKYQIKSNEYLEKGAFPVIDQGKKKITAYSNNVHKIFKCPGSGVIIFGDHTRILKYIDFNFVVGADGTQVLTSRGNSETNFLFYQLQNKEIPNTGYNRHFKFLKEMRFEIPTLCEQEAISLRLNRAVKEIELIEMQLEAIKLQKKGLMQLLLTGIVRVQC